MKRISFFAIAVSLTLCFAAQLLTAQVTVTQVHAFTGPDGSNPRAPLVKGSDGNFYGTTSLGGSGTVNPFGTVFRVSPNGSFTSLYSFSFQVTGDEPYAGVIQASDGNFYGTTRGTGSYNGNIFRITPSGAFTELHAFGGFFFGDDGAHPEAELVQASDGNLYGVTHDNSFGAGVIFRISPTGANFMKLIALPGGANSYSNLVEGSDGNLYGTTANGGAAGRGSIFRISKSGAFTTIHEYTFAAGDGWMPLAGLMRGSDGNFYGTTANGGTDGRGIVFRISENGNYATLHSFTLSEGSAPQATVVEGADGNFYGTTRTGGQFSLGTIYRLKPNGDFTTLYSFSVSGSVGYVPEAELVQGSDGAFYGTTTSGTQDPIRGAVFRMSLPTPVTIQFSAASYSVSEGGDAANITVSRIGETTEIATVNYATSDTAALTNCDVVNGVASSRCDYPTSVGTIRFAVGETSKTVSIPLVDDSYAEGNESFTITLSNVTGATLGSPGTATVVISDNEGSNGPNPIDGTAFFVRQQYLDFLNREPDPGGYAAWQAVINGCPPGNTTCDRIHVSSAFFRSPEFQDRGYFVYRFYPVSFGRKPDYVEFVPDLAKVSGFLSDAELEAAKQAFIAEFMSRPAFVMKFNGLNNTAYVDMLLTTAGITHPARDFWIAALGNGTRTRAQVLREIAESSEVYNKYYNQAFVVMQYFGYLRRDPDAFYLDWIQVLNTTSDFRGMVNGFMNSLEYRFRFGP